jgi:rhamnogalacturonyl hydrolase YesR
MPFPSLIRDNATVMSDPTSGTTPLEAFLATKIIRSINLLIRWVESHNYSAYDPGDGNNSFLHGLTFNNLLLERLLQQAVYRAPFNLRPWLGISPHTSTKGMGYMAWGYVKMWRFTGQPDYEKKARHCLDWLIQHRSKTYKEFCWGNDFSFSSRGGKIPKGEGTIVWSSLIGQAFIEAHEAFGDSSYLDVASNICDWILKLPREETRNGVCLSYIAYEQCSIHNSNMLGAALLAKIGRFCDRGDALGLARDAIVYSCSRQNEDGSWFYGEHPKYHWIDNFHTGYNLDSLRRYTDATGDHAFDDHLARGFEYFKNNFFEADGCPKYYHNRKYPIDIQCAAQAIDTLTFFSDLVPDSLPLAQKVAQWTINHMQAPDGHFYYRDLGWAINKTPMLHWGQGTMFKALAHLLSYSQ